MQSEPSIFKKLLSLFSVVRGYNIAVIVLAQYLSAIFIFSSEKSLRAVVLNKHLFFIVLASVCVIASGYIINNFYDAKSDKINKPQKAHIDSYVSSSTQLSVYFALNCFGFLLVFLVSWRAGLFFGGYIFLLWFYSHKLKKLPFVQALSATMLAVLPFLAIMVYYKNTDKIIFLHGAFLFLLLLIREIIKNFEKLKGSVLLDRKTIVTAYGEAFAKKLSLFLVLLTLVVIYFILQSPAVGLMKYYFALTALVLLIFLVFLFKSTTTRQYNNLHNVLKVLILIGVFSIALIDKSLLIDKIL